MCGNPENRQIFKKTRRGPLVGQRCAKQQKVSVTSMKSYLDKSRFAKFVAHPMCH